MHSMSVSVLVKANMSLRGGLSRSTLYLHKQVIRVTRPTTLYGHLSMPMHLWPVHLHPLTLASRRELRNQCLTSKHRKIQHLKQQAQTVPAVPALNNTILHVGWMGSEIKQTRSERELSALPSLTNGHELVRGGLPLKHDSKCRPCP